MSWHVALINREIVLILTLVLWVLGASFMVQQQPLKGSFTTSSSFAHVSAEVYDGVLSSTDCEKVSIYVQKQRINGLNVFDRDKITKLEHMSSIERLLDDILQQLGDESRWVEYWWGLNWISHDMHRDVDERMCFEQGLIRFPRNGHVLYLDKDEGITGGQTVVLTEGVSIEGEGEVQRDLYIVPPQPGRLLRFNGSLLHAVPRPSLEYFLNGGLDAEDLCQLPAVRPLDGCPCLQELKHSAECGIDLTCPDYQRSMPLKRINLLFNTWPDKPPGSGNEVSPPKGDTPRGLECLLPVDASESLVPFLPVAGEANGEGMAGADLTMRIKLPGDRRRRDSYERTLALRASLSAPEAFIIQRDTAGACKPRVVTVVSQVE